MRNYNKGINSGKSTNSSDPSISNYVGGGLIDTDIDDVNSKDCADYATGGLIGAINAGNSMDCAYIKVSDYSADGLIAIAINAGNSEDCAEDSVGGLIADIDAGVSMNCADKSISYYAADGLIATPINANGLVATPIYSADNADTNVSDDAIDGLMMLCVDCSCNTGVMVMM